MRRWRGACLPSEYKTCHPAEGKRILRDAAKALCLPREVWGSRDKLGFASPVPTWLNGPLAAWADAQIHTALTEVPASWRPLLEGGLKQGGRFDRTRMQVLMASAWFHDQTVRAAA
ncbi:asparagine synthase-related protein [Streptomyces sp. NPDC057474]|uniref:asparagine synthase-related protein n=1 Tax=Streptomyces sp. NPDC057474 TaxID=3346144 RepID=UPI00369B1941